MVWKKNELKNPKWQRMRLEIMDRDNWTCTKCYAKDKFLHVHHRLYIDGRKPWEYCISDLETVCESCHFDIHRIQKLYSSAPLEVKFNMWYELIGDSPKVKNIIKHDVFLIIELYGSDNHCQILHVPSFKAIDCPLSSLATYELMVNQPASLPELKQIIMKGSSNNCLGPIG